MTTLNEKYRDYILGELERSVGRIPGTNIEVSESKDRVVVRSPGLESTMHFDLVLGTVHATSPSGSRQSSLEEEAENLGYYPGIEEE